MLPKWQKHLQHKLHSQPHLPMETTSYGKAWRAFRKQNSGLSSTTYYSTVPITCTQIRIHQTQSLHYDKSLKCSSLRHIVTTNFAARIYHLLCEILLQRSLTRTISWWDIMKIVPISRWFIMSMRCFADISALNRQRSEQNAFFVDYHLHYFCTLIVGCGFALTSYLYWLRYIFPFYTS